MHRHIYTTCLFLGLVTGPSLAGDSLANPLSGWLGGKNDATQTYRLPADGLIMVQNGDKIYFTTPNARYLIRGQLYDVWNGEFVESVDKAKQLGDRIHLSKLKIDIDEDLKPFYVGSGGKEMVAFIDPHCPYCHKLLQQMQALGDEYRFKLILIPALGDKSAETIRLLRCGSSKENYNQDVVSRLLKTDYQGLRDERCDLDPFLKSAILAKILGVTGVPFLINQDGRVLKGYVKDLKSWLEKENAS